MADAKKCDRCGNFYQRVELNAIEELGKAMSDMVAYIATPVNVTKQICAIESCLDLCPSCSKSLKRWAKCVEEEDLK